MWICERMQSVDAECGFVRWLQSVDAECGFVRWMQSVDVECGCVFSLWFRCFIGVKRNAERYMFCFPRTWMRSGPETGNPGSVSVRLSPTLTFWPFSQKACLLRKKVHFGTQNRILAQKAHFLQKSELWGPKSHLGPKGVILHQKRLVLQASAAWGPKNAFWRKNAFLRKKCNFGPKCVLDRKMHL